MSDDENENLDDLEQDLPRWLDELRPGVPGLGFIEKALRYSMIFSERPVKRLLVTFDNLSNVGNTSLQREPWAYKFAQDCNISHLGVMAHAANWYRDPDLIARLQELAKSGFFDGYERVVFAGVSMGGYAAIAFGSLVPGAHVVSVNPQTTLDTEIVPWETRYENGRRQDWTLPLGDTAELTGKLGRVNIFYDPYHALDKQHIARLGGDNIQVFNCRYSSHKTAVFLRRIDALKPVMMHCIFDELTEAEFYSLYRARRNLPWFRGAVSAYFQKRERPDVAHRFTKLFRRRLRTMKGEAEAQDASVHALEDRSIYAEHPSKAALQGTKTSETGNQQGTGQDAEIAKTTEAPVPAKPHRVIIDRPLGARRNETRTIITTMKNEGPFMLEWIAYNRAIGFTHIEIYTNDCTDGTEEIARQLEKTGFVTHVDNAVNERESPQRKALRRALHQSENCRNTDWLICMDCDEFLNIRVGDKTLDALFDTLGEADAVSFGWKLFGNSGKTAYQNKFVIEQFTWAAEEDFMEAIRARGLKTMFRPSREISKFGVHRPKFHEQPEGFIWKDAGGLPMPDSYYHSGWAAYREFNHDYARLYHYAVRSIDSFLVKKDRGRTNHINRDQGADYWADMNMNQARDESLVPMVARTRAEFDKLLADPEIARMHTEACRWHRAKIKELKAKDGAGELRDLLQRLNKRGKPHDGPEGLKALLGEK